MGFFNVTSVFEKNFWIKLCSILASIFLPENICVVGNAQNSFTTLQHKSKISSRFKLRYDDNSARSLIGFENFHMYTILYLKEYQYQET